MKDYWRADVAGLYVRPGADGNSLELIGRGLAAADDRSVTDMAFFGTRAPKAGFWFRAIRLSGEREVKSDQFAMCCFPARYRRGIRSTYVIREDGVVYRKDLGHGRGIETYPADPLTEGWAMVD